MLTRYFYLLLFVVWFPSFVSAINQYDILINEVMEDPTRNGDQTLGLPNVEYIELYNRRETAIELDQYTLNIGTKKITFSPYLFPPKSFLLLTESDNTLLEQYGKVVFFSNFPTLPSAQTIVLKDLFGETIDAIAYDQEWYQSTDKAKGAYALERINPSAPCIGKSNWIASTALIGGTPGKENDSLVVIKDTSAPLLINSYPIATNQVRLTFDKAMQVASILDPENYQLSNNTIVGVSLTNAIFSEVLLELATDLSADRIQELALSSTIKDCIDNPITEHLFPMALPQQATTSDILINEILFNPQVGGNDFVELYNASNKILDLSDLAIVNQQRNDAAIPIIVERLFFPNEFIVLTESPTDILERYTVDNPINLIAHDLPSLGDEAGNITVFNDALVIDQLDYLETFHANLLSNTEGVSLERISSTKDSQDPSNWYSAAATAGYATPATHNSQNLPASLPTSNHHFQFSTKTISPDGDGYADFLQIDYTFEEIGNVLNIAIYDAVGHLVQSIAQDDLAAISGGYQWNGSTLDGQKVPLGIYVVWIEYFNQLGETKRLKEAVVVAGKL